MAAYSQSSFPLSMLARRLKVVVQAGPIPPAVEKTNGTKLAPSTSRTLCSYWRLLLRSCLECWLASDVLIAEGAFGWKTRTSNRDLEKWSPQKPRALISRRASLVTFALLGSSSPSSGWRGGSCCWIEATTASLPLHERHCDTKSAMSCSPGHHHYIWFALERPCRHYTEESCACTTPVSYPRLSSSATSSSYSEILRWIYTTAHGVLQCCVVLRVSRVSEVTGKGAAESRKSHCSLATWATGTWGAFWV